MIVKYIKVHPEAKVPTKATENAACFDVYAVEDYSFDHLSRRKVRTGLKFEIPVGWEMQIRPRGGKSWEGFEIMNSPGTLDADYRGELFILMRWNAPEGLGELLDYSKGIEVGERIAQIKLARIYDTIFEEVEELSDTERGEGAFGSTGV